MPRSFTATLLRFASLLVLIGGAVALIVSLIAALSPRPDGTPHGKADVVAAILPPLELVTLAGLLFGVAAVIDRTGAAVATRRDEDDTGRSVAEVDMTAVTERLERVQSAIERLPAMMSESLRHAAPPATAVVAPEAEPGSPNYVGATHSIYDVDAPHAPHSNRGTSPGSNGAAAADPAVFDRLVSVLEELREVSLLDDDQKRNRLASLRERRRTDSLALAEEATRRGDWRHAEAALSIVEKEFSGDPQAQAVRRSLEASRSAAAADTSSHVREHVEDLMAMGKWDEALAEASDFAKDFPNSEEARILLTRVTRDRDEYRDAATQMLIDEIRAESERRQWRKALSAAQNLLRSFGDHRRADTVRRQLATLQENAGVEERHEAEGKIQGLLRDRRYGEAIDIAEDLIAKFPRSKQAESLGALLPKLRELEAETHEV